jgi:hypothetical protein
MPTLSEVITITGGIVGIGAAITTASAFVIRAVMAPLREEVVKLRVSLDAFQKCHERVERELREHVEDSRETHRAIFQRLEAHAAEKR